MFRIQKLEISGVNNAEDWYCNNYIIRRSSDAIIYAINMSTCDQTILATYAPFIINLSGATGRTIAISYCRPWLFFRRSGKLIDILNTATNKWQAISTSEKSIDAILGVEVPLHGELVMITKSGLYFYGLINEMFLSHCEQ